MSLECSWRELHLCSLFSICLQPSLCRVGEDGGYRIQGVLGEASVALQECCIFTVHICSIHQLTQLLLDT